MPPTPRCSICRQGSLTPRSEAVRPAYFCTFSKSSGDALTRRRAGRLRRRGPRRQEQAGRWTERDQHGARSSTGRVGDMSRPEEFGKIAALSELATTPSGDTRGGRRSLATEPRASDPHPRRRAAPWSVAQEFVHDGYCYRLIRRPIAGRDEIHLTPREDEALSHLRQGLRNQEIGKRLGVQPSTVRVLLFRASAKLHATTRAELVAAYESFLTTRRLSDDTRSFKGDR